MCLLSLSFYIMIINVIKKMTKRHQHIWKSKQVGQVFADWLCTRWLNSEKGKRETDSKAGVSRTTALVSLLLHKDLVCRVINKMCYISTQFTWTSFPFFFSFVNTMNLVKAALQFSEVNTNKTKKEDSWLSFST